ncbi:MAG: type II toxin-antitoxin system PemK/MazF family toxin [Acetatifactor sp.]|nr:type II toxin-antitoxin system PemK/MazF family toxin [Acetatifactor sp.]
MIISKNAFIKATGIFHVCPILTDVHAGPVHIPVCGKNGESGTVICEQIKAIDPKVRVCKRVDILAYEDIMNVSDTIQGIFEYD